MDEKDALFGMFKQYMQQGLHHQQQRSTIANIVLVLSAAIVALVTFENEICGPDAIAGIFLVGLGLFGAAWSAKQQERYAYYLRRARGYRDALAAALRLDMAGINKTAELGIPGTGARGQCLPPTSPARTHVAQSSAADRHSA